MEIQDILSLQDNLIKDPSLQPSGDVSYCNFAVQKFLTEGYGYTKMNGLMANEMVEYMALHFLEWQKLIDAEHAKQRVDLGDAVIAGHPYLGHGHVASLRPNARLSYGGKWGVDVPLLANIGEKNGLIYANFAFPIADSPPNYYRLLSV